MDGNLPLEELFEQATEDTSHYLWAVEAWSDPPEGYDRGYLLMLALAHRARSRLALELIGLEIPPEYKGYKDRLVNMRQTAEKMLNEIVLNDADKIENIIGNQLTEGLNDVEELLQKVSRIARDGDLMEDPEWVADDLRETSLDFMTRFQQLALTGEELEQTPFNTAVNSKSFQDQLKAIDLQFQQYFGYFHIIGDFFPEFKKREYGRRCWWLERIPKPDDIQDDESLDSLMDSFLSTFRAGKLQALEDCPRADKTTAYALGELDAEEGNKIREHIQSCRNCLNLFLDVKTAENRARQQGDETSVMYPGVQKAIDGKSKGPFPFINKFRRKIAEYLSPLLRPRPVAALVAACLVVFISVYALWNQSDLPPESPTTVEIILLGRTSIGVRGGEAGFRGGEAQYEEFKLDRNGILKSGDFFQVQSRIDRDSYIYVVFHDSLNQISGIKQGYIAGGEEFFLPDKDNWYQLDANTGKETIYVLASDKEINDFDNRVQRLSSAKVADIRQIFPEATIRSFSFKHE